MLQPAPDFGLGHSRAGIGRAEESPEPERRRHLRSSVLQRRTSAAEAWHERRKPGGTSFGVVSRSLLAELQAGALATVRDAVVLVEGVSDCLAVAAAAARCGRNLRDEGVAVVPMGGATNLGRFLAHFGPSGSNVPVAGLCDLGEEEFVGRVLERAGLTSRADRAAMASIGFFVCERDLEDELIRALGTARVEAIIEREGELASLRKLQQMPFHRRHTIDEQIHRFMGVRSGRKYRYAPLLVDALDVGELPQPLQDVLSHV
jgi:hypothetical protein